MYFCEFIQTDYKAKQVFFINNVNNQSQGKTHAHKNETQGSLCNVQNDNRSSPMEEYFWLHKKVQKHIFIGNDWALF